jgi:hypothetical protein
VYNVEVEGDHCYRAGGQALLVHNTSPNPDLVPDPANTATHYRAEDCTHPGSYIDFTLQLGVVFGSVEAHGAVRGTEFFDAMIDHFGVTNITAIHGIWTEALDSNLGDFNDARARGVSEPEAARDTWTGQRARDHGFTQAQVTFRTPPMFPHSAVTAVFTRP